MRRKHIALLAASLVSGLAATATFVLAAPGGPAPAPGTEPIRFELDRTRNVISLSDMVIGDSTRGTLSVRNTGAQPASFRLSGRLVPGSSAALAGRLMLTVYRDRDGVPSARIFPTGGQAASLSSFNAAGATIGRLERSAPGSTADRATLYFHLHLAGTGSPAGDNALTRKAAGEIFEVVADKVTGNGNGSGPKGRTP